MARESLENRKDTGDIRTDPDQTQKAGPTHCSQKAEDYNCCFEKSDGRCSHTDCRSTQDCPAEGTHELQTNTGLLPSLDPEQYEPNVKKGPGVRDEIKGSVRYALIGAGQCGGRLAKSFYDLGYKKALVVNTTRRDLDALDIPHSQKFLMDTGQENTCRDMEAGTEAVQQCRQDILHLARRIFGTGVDHIMVCFGAGGGAGGGSAVELIEIAKMYARYIGLKNPNKTVGVVMTLPAAGKVGCPLVAENAYKVANVLCEMARAGEISPLIIVDNDKISKMYPGMTVTRLWPSINNTFAGLFDIFNRLSALGSRYTSFDRFDYLSIMESSGCLMMGRAKVNKLDDPFSISEAVKNNIERTLFACGLDLPKIKAGGCIIVGGKQLMANLKGLQDNIDYAFDVLSEIAGHATIHRGIYEDNSDSLRVYTIIGGLNSPTTRLQQLRTGLYFKPDVVDTEGLPLRERREDILPLAEHFLAKQADLYHRPRKILSLDARKLLLHYSWPGNVRELAKAMERAHELNVGGVIQADVLPFEIIFSESDHYPEDVLFALSTIRRRIIDKTLALFQGREVNAARILGIEPAHLNRLISKLNMCAPRENIAS